MSTDTSPRRIAVVSAGLSNPSSTRGKPAGDSTVESVEGVAVRPDHRMVAHTGFLTSARRSTG